MEALVRRRVRCLSAAATAVLLLQAFAPRVGWARQDPQWIERSNSHAQVLLEALARISPEGAGSLGVEGFDTEILDLSPGFI